MSIGLLKGGKPPIQLTIRRIAVMYRQEVHELGDAVAPRHLAQRRSYGRRGNRLREVTNCPRHLARPHGIEDRALYDGTAPGGVVAFDYATIR
jgi:hypothetical protein